MVKSVKGYVRIGFALSEGLAFNLEGRKDIDPDFVENHLKGAFRSFRPSLWQCNPSLPSREDKFASRIKYSLAIDNDVGIYLTRTDMDRENYNFELEIKHGEKTQIVRDELFAREFLERLFNHVGKYASPAF